MDFDFAQFSTIKKKTLGGMKIVSFLKKHVPALVLILILLIGATALFFYK